MSLPIPAQTSRPFGSLRFDDTLGALLISAQLIAVTYGIFNMQTYTYYKRCSRDPIWLRSTIAFLWTLDTLHCVFVMHASYYYSVTNYGFPIVLERPTWSLLAALIVADLSDAIVSFLYVHRLRVLSVKWPTLVFLMLAVTLEYGTAIVIVALGAHRTFLQFQSQFAWLWYINWVGQVTIDLTITVSLSLTLRMFKTSARKTKDILRRLVIYAVCTGSLTSTFSVASLIVYAASPKNLVFIAVSNMIPKLMVNSMLALLNARPSVQTRVDIPTEPVSIQFRTLPTSRDTSENANGSASMAITNSLSQKHIDATPVLYGVERTSHGS